MITFALIRQKNPAVGGVDYISEIDRLDLSGCGVDEIDNLDVFSHIKELTLAHNNIRQVQNLRHFTQLEVLDLSYNSIDSAGLLASAAGIPPGLQRINLTANPCALDQDALAAIQDQFEDLGIIIDVETVEEGEPDGVLPPEGPDPLPQHRPPSRSKLPLNNDTVLKEIVDRKCKLQNIAPAFDLDATLQTLDSELSSALDLSKTTRTLRHDQTHQKAIAQEESQDRRSSELRMKLKMMSSDCEAGGAAFQDVLQKIRITSSVPNEKSRFEKP